MANPFLFLQKTLLGKKRKLSEVLREAETLAPFSESFVSTEQTITAAGSLQIAHSLSSAPKLIQSRIICKTAEYNYSIGDELIINSDNFSSTSNTGLSIVPDSTNINIRYGSAANTIIIINKTTGVTQSITNANWKLILYAWA